MGLTMYLKRANLHGYSLQQAQAASNYYNEMENKKKNETIEKISVDPFGSYTGRGNDPYEKPVQDADDL